MGAVAAREDMAVAILVPLGRFAFIAWFALRNKSR
jgi:hypothetical protein